LIFSINFEEKFQGLEIFLPTATRKIEQSAGVEKRAKRTKREAESFAAADASKHLLNADYF